MLILAFDTTQDACSVAIAQKGCLLASDFKKMQRGHAEHLLPMIEHVRSEAKISYGSLDLIVVTTGPGAFTGVRVGLAAARALALALNVPLLGVSNFEVLARAAVFDIMDEYSGIIVSIDARRGQLYTQAFDASGEPLAAPVIDVIEAYMAPNISKPGFIVGSGAEILQSVLPDWRINEAICQPDAAFMAVTAENWQNRINPSPPSPIYLRAPDANLSAGPIMKLTST